MTETLVIFLFCTVNCTWTGPQRVSATAPVTVLLALEVAVAELALEGLELLEPADVVGAAVAEADVEPVVVEPTVPVGVVICGAAGAAVVPAVAVSEVLVTLPDELAAVPACGVEMNAVSPPAAFEDVEVW